MSRALQRTLSLAIALLIGIVAAWVLLPVVARGYAPSPIEAGQAIETDVEWTGDRFVEGDLLIGNASRPISVWLHDCSVRVNGTVQVDSLDLAFQPVTLRVERCILTLGLTTSRILLDHSDPTRTGVSTGSTILISDSTIDTPFESPAQFPGGLVLRSGEGTNNRAKVVIENTTFRNIGDYWGKGLAAVHTRLDADTYSVFTADSVLRNLTFEYPQEDMNGNAVAIVAGDSLAVAEHTFRQGFMGVGYSTRIAGNRFERVCRAIYDPLEGAQIEGNMVAGLYCKTIDFWTPGGMFRRNTVTDSIGPTFNPGADNWIVVDNDFIRSRIVGNTASSNEVRGNRFTGITPESGEAVIWDRGTKGRILDNHMADIPAGGIYLQPHPNFTYTYETPLVQGNLIERFWGSSDVYPALKIEDAARARIISNEMVDGYRAILLARVQEALLEGNVATRVREGLAVEGSTNILVRNSTFDASHTGLVLLGGNSEITLVNVTFRSVSFADDADSFAYHDYVDFSFPGTGSSSVRIVNGFGELVYTSVVGAASVSDVQLHLFDRSRSTVVTHGPFTITVGGLTPGLPYAVLRDGEPRHSIEADETGLIAFEESIEVGTSFAIVENPDRVAPSQIVDLSATDLGSGRWQLTWTAPGDDGSEGTATEYEVRMRVGSLLDEASWDDATVYAHSWRPARAGMVESRILEGLVENGVWGIGIVAYDEMRNRGRPSNSVWVAGPDTIAPSRIEDLDAIWNANGTAVLTWTAPGDDESTGRAVRYEVRFQQTGPIDAENWSGAALFTDAWPASPAGTREVQLVIGLSPELDNWFAIRAVDESSNWGPVSTSALLPRTLREPPVIALSIVGTPTSVAADRSARLVAWAFTSDGNVFRVTASWSVENGSVEAPDTFLPWSVGRWQVCASYAALTACTIVTVVPGTLARLRADPPSIELLVGQRIRASVVAEDIRGNFLTEHTVTWRVAPSSLGFVSGGMFEASEPGDGFLVAEATDGSASLSVAIPVTVLVREAPLVVTGSGLGDLMWGPAIVLVLVMVGLLASNVLRRRKRRAGFIGQTGKPSQPGATG